MLYIFLAWVMATAGDAFCLPCILPAAPDGKVMVFILAGQSNAVGYNHIRELHAVTPEVKEIIEGKSTTLFWPGSNAKPGFADTWIKLQPGGSGIAVSEPYKDGCFGPEIGFALDLQKMLPGNRIAIIKYAEGATGIARSTDYNDYIPALKGFDDKGRNWHPPGNGKPPGLLYSNLIENINSALAALKKKGLDAEICGFIWMQGEHEAGISRQMADDYEKILTGFREAVREDLNLENLPFVIGEINSHTWAFGDLARERQARACLKDPNSALIKTIDLSRGSIGGAAHFDADGMMELGRRFAAGILPFIRKNPTQAQPTRITFESLLKELADREVIARWPDPEFRLLQASSFDRRSVEKDKEGWFANDDWSNYIRKETRNGRDEYVLIDADGPGAITRFWIGGHPNQKNHFRFYIDGQDTPFWEADHTGALTGQNRDIGVPLSQRSVDRDSLNINFGAQPGHNLYAPIPFEKHIKITIDRPKGDAGTGFWYNINYRIYNGDVQVESFSKETPSLYASILNETNKILNDFMKLPPLEAHASGETITRRTSFSLAPEAAETMTFDQPGSVRRITLALKAGDMNAAVTNTWIRMDFDGRTTVEVPAGFFFGCGDQLVEAKDWYRKVDLQGNMACFWVMPFQNKAVIKIINKGVQAISGSIETAAGYWTWDDHSMHFNANFKRLDEMPAKKTVDFNYITLENQAGVYAGDILQAFKTFRGWWGEGDEKIYIDGSIFPDHFGTGSEDYYGYSWGHPETFNNIFNGQPIGNANTGTIGGTTVNSRVRSLDGIPFKKSLRFDMESWQLYGGPVTYSLACFWYSR